MVSICDSWQTKAEKAAERRTLSKQKKQQRDRTRLNKLLAQKLLAFLQERNHSILLSASTGANKTSDLEIHLWTDSNPRGHPFRAHLSTDKEDNVSCHERFASPSEKRNSRPRSNSCIDKPPESPTKSKRGRNRASSDAGAYPSAEIINKQRARSGSHGSEPQNSQIDEEESSLSMYLPLCMEHFFGYCTRVPTSQSCGRSRRSNQVLSCVHGLHPCPKKGNATLASILLKQQKGPGMLKSTSSNLDRSTINQQTLASASTMAKTVLNLGPATMHMNMLYHLDSKLNMSELQYDSDEHASLLVETISTLLSMHECSTSSIVYLAINDMLVFDRYRDGIVLTSAEEEFLLFGGSKRRTVSVGDVFEHRVSPSENATRENDESLEAYHQRLVQYLPGNVLEYILSFLPQSAVASFPRVCKAWHNEIWFASQGLWTHLMERNNWPYPQEIDSSKNGASLYRETFVKHYKAVRDVNAIINGLEHLISQKSCISASKDIALIDFMDLIGRTVTGDTHVRRWSASRVIVGSGDCTLHIYDIVDDSSGNKKRCKQLLRVMAAPFSNTKKRSCTLVGLDLDDRCVGCFYRAVIEDSQEIWFSVIDRDEVLGAGRGANNIAELDEETLESYDLTALLLHSIKQSDDNMIQRWLVSMFAALKERDFEGLPIAISENFVACGNGEFLFEANFMYLPQDDEPMQSAELAEPIAFSKLFLFSSDCGNITWISPFHSHTEALTLCKLPQDSTTAVPPPDKVKELRESQSGCAHAAFLLGSSEIVQLTVHGPGNVSHTRISCPNHELLSPSLLGLSQTSFTLFQQSGDGLHFLPLSEDETSNELVETEVLDDNNSMPVVPLREEYLILFGVCTHPLSQTQETVTRETFAKLYHVPSRTVIHRASFKHNSFTRLSFCAAHKDGLIAISVDSFGLLVAGHGVSSITNENWDRKTKRKKGARTKGKRDYFARGMRRTMA